MIAKESIDYEIEYLYEDTEVAQAIEWCEHNRSKYVFLVNDKKMLIGYVPLDLLYEVEEELVIDLVQPIEEKLTLKEDSHIFDIIRKGESLDNFLFPIVDSNNIVEGFCSANSLIRTFVKDNQIQQKGGIIILEVAIRNYSLADIARIIESNDAIILSLSLKHKPETDILEITLKINKTDLKNIQASLERFDYTITNTIHQSEFDLQLQERVDNLLKYLEL